SCSNPTADRTIRFPPSGPAETSASCCTQAARPSSRREELAMTSQEIEFGLDTPVFVTVDESGEPLSGDVVVRNTIEEAVLADAVGIDSFNIGEHYRADLMDSAGHVMLAAIAGRTERIRLGTAVT